MISQSKGSPIIYVHEREVEIWERGASFLAPPQGGLDYFCPWSGRLDFFDPSGEAIVMFLCLPFRREMMTPPICKLTPLSRL